MRWRRDGVWGHLLETLRPWECRALERQPAPSAGHLDAQTIKTATHSEDIGFEGNKKITGRKRHILVVTLGGLLPWW
jgi:putative transposase